MLYTSAEQNHIVKKQNTLLILTASWKCTSKKQKKTKQTKTATTYHMYKLSVVYHLYLFI